MIRKRATSGWSVGTCSLRVTQIFISISSHGVERSLVVCWEVGFRRSNRNMKSRVSYVVASVPHDRLREVLGSARVTRDNTLGISPPDGPKSRIQTVPHKAGRDSAITWFTFRLKPSPRFRSSPSRQSSVQSKALHTTHQLQH